MANMRTVEPRTTHIVEADFEDAPVPGAKRVLWFIDGEWVHKGWLMPAVIPCGDGYKYGGV